ncbi:MAG TPA: VOC family protein [Acidimicrobiia bacterium]|jgi:catechol 2,3-dioxygenase-like lactoylglutathione lyase family enzyme|nr:VOC family protein [Acidimicrobiia bacterium]
MITGLAHTALCVADVDAAVAWYHDVLGLAVLSPPYRMEGPAIEHDMGALVPSPVVVKAAIVGVADGSDRVIEVIEYPNAPGRVRPADAAVIDHGFTHVALLCDDVAATRADLEARGVRFLVDGVADVAGVRTTWIADPWDNVLILVEKVRRPERPYFQQF